MGKVNGYVVHALDTNGTLWTLGEQGWWRGRGKVFISLAFARYAGQQNQLPQNIVDAYLLSTETNTTFDFYIDDLQLAMAALAMVEAGEMSYENAEILSRIKRADWQLQFLSEARDLAPNEFADLVHGVLRRMRRVPQ